MGDIEDFQNNRGFCEGCPRKKRACTSCGTECCNQCSIWGFSYAKGLGFSRTAICTQVCLPALYEVKTELASNIGPNGKAFEDDSGEPLKEEIVVAQRQEAPLSSAPPAASPSNFQEGSPYRTLEERCSRLEQMLTTGRRLEEAAGRRLESAVGRIERLEGEVRGKDAEIRALRGILLEWAQSKNGPKDGILDPGVDFLLKRNSPRNSDNLSSGAGGSSARPASSSSPRSGGGRFERSSSPRESSEIRDAFEQRLQDYPFTMRAAYDSERDPPRSSPRGESSDSVLHRRAELLARLTDSSTGGGDRSSYESPRRKLL